MGDAVTYQHELENQNPTLCLRFRIFSHSHFLLIRFPVACSWLRTGMARSTRRFVGRTRRRACLRTPRPRSTPNCTFQRRTNSSPRISRFSRRRRHRRQSRRLRPQRTIACSSWARWLRPSPLACPRRRHRRRHHQPLRPSPRRRRCSLRTQGTACGTNSTPCFANRS